MEATLMSSAEASRVVAPAGAPTVSLNVVDIRPELEIRPRRRIERHRGTPGLLGARGRNGCESTQHAAEARGGRRRFVRRAHGGHQLARGRRIPVGSSGWRLRSGARWHNATGSKPLRGLHRPKRDAVDASCRSMFSGAARRATIRRSAPHPVSCRRQADRYRLGRQPH